MVNEVLQANLASGYTPSFTEETEHVILTLFKCLQLAVAIAIDFYK